MGKKYLLSNICDAGLSRKIVTSHMCDAAEKRVKKMSESFVTIVFWSNLIRQKRIKIFFDILFGFSCKSDSAFSGVLTCVLYLCERIFDSV